MKYLVTGSAGHLGQALMMQLQELGHADAVGVDILASPSTTHVGNISNREFVRGVMVGIDVIFHTATLHKPHVATHSRQQFVDTNVTGTLTLLEEAASQPTPPVFIFTSTTSVFGDALKPACECDPAVWITEDTPPVPKNIYGVTKIAAEDLCQLFHRNQGLNSIILRTARFFPEADDEESTRNAYSDQNAKGNEYLHRRVEIQDCVNAHLSAAARARAIGFGKYIISATTPFINNTEELMQLRLDPAAVVAKHEPLFEEAYNSAGWRMSSSIDRVYDNAKARRDLEWHPKYGFEYICKSVLYQKSVKAEDGVDITSPRAKMVGMKYYHPEATVDFDSKQPYPVMGRS